MASASASGSVDGASAVPSVHPTEGGFIVSGPATLNGDQLTVTGPGPIAVIAYQPGDNYWQSSDLAVQTVNIPLASVTGLSATALTTSRTP